MRLRANVRSALEAFTDVLHKYVTECGYFAHLNCELSGRTECNLIDVQYALDKLSTPIPELWKFFNTRHLGEEVHFAKVSTLSSRLGAARLEGR